MPKYMFQWKDPDYYDGYEIDPEEWERLHKLGIREYLVVEVDTGTGEVKVKGRD